MSAVYMIAGGGTGGHIFPALAMGERLLEKVEGADLVFVGTRYGMERELIPKAGYRLLTLPIRGLLGKALGQKLALLWRLPVSLILSFTYLMRYRPKVVIGVGGYASMPLVWTASLLRFPTMIQEQNAFPGLSNRLCAKTAKLACLGFSEAAQRLACPSVVTGNPVRGGLKKGGFWSGDRKTILVLGGSQGAASLNRLLPDLFKQINLQESGLRVYHQAGRGKAESVRRAYQGSNFQVEVTEFIDDMARAFDQALIVVCRAGASTIAELKHMKIPAVFVPFPGATHDHQTFNARSLADRGAAVLIPETELEQAAPILGSVFTDPGKLLAMSRAYPDHTADAADLCADIALALQNRRSVADIVKEFGSRVS